MPSRSPGLRGLLLALCIGLLAACGGTVDPGDEDSSARDGSRADARGSEVAPDDGAEEDAEPPPEDATPVEAGADDAALDEETGFEDPPDDEDAALPIDAVADAPPDASVDARADASPDAPADAMPDVTPPSDAGIAPPNAIPGETLLRDPSVAVRLAAGEERVYRVESNAAEHVGFRLTFTPVRAANILRLHRWNGSSVVTLGETDAGSGIRVLAALDATTARTLWVRLVAREALTGTLSVTRTPFSEGSTCSDDCARLLQLPLRNDPRVDGYDYTTATVFRYQFGRRDLLMFLRYAGRSVIRDGHAPFVPEDLSQWNGETPGTDTGSPRHSSHQRGKDVDLSLYGTDGLAPWRTYCRPERTSAGRECVAGTRMNYDAETNALYFLRYFESRRVTMCFLDRELIAPTVTAANSLASRGMFPTDIARQYGDGRHLQHWPNHDNHIHVRVSEAAQAAEIDEGAFVFEPFEPP